MVLILFVSSGTISSGTYTRGVLSVISWLEEVTALVFSVVRTVIRTSEFSVSHQKVKVVGTVASFYTTGHWRKSHSRKLKQRVLCSIQRHQYNGY
jgi:hypothetical protein